MRTLKTFTSSCNTKTATIVLTSDETLVVEFRYLDRLVGEIEYADKSYYYVEDAAENWANGVMQEETIRRYKRAA